MWALARRGATAPCAWRAKGADRVEHYWRDIPGPQWFFGADIYRDFVAQARPGAVAVELGAWKGRSAACMGVEIANAGKAIAFYSVDHWRGSTGESAHDADEDCQAGRLYQAFTHNIAPVKDHIIPIRSDTVAAAQRFADGSIDFLYVDASHTYAGVMADLVAWYPKVKTGGFIAGDDWHFGTRGEPGVRNAVRDFLGPAVADLRLLPGSSVDPDWTQWSFVKTQGQAVSSPARRAIRRIGRGFMRAARRVRRMARLGGGRRPAEG